MAQFIMLLTMLYKLFLSEIDKMNFLLPFFVLTLNFGSATKFRDFDRRREFFESKRFFPQRALLRSEDPAKAMFFHKLLLK